MQIQLNGQIVETQAQTVSELLQEQQIDSSCVATALNGNFVPRSAYSRQPLAAGCQLEVLSPMQGG